MLVAGDRHRIPAPAPKAPASTSGHAPAVQA